MKPRLCLLVIRVTDLPRSRPFYEALGLSFRQERHDGGPVHLACELAETVFEIYSAKSTADVTNRTRLGFYVTDMDSLAVSAISQGGSVASPPQDSAWGRRMVMPDPDDHIEELVGPFHV